MANEKRTLDENGVLYLWNKVKTFVTSKLPTKPPSSRMTAALLQALTFLRARLHPLPCRR